MAEEAPHDPAGGDGRAGAESAPAQPGPRPDPTLEQWYDDDAGPVVRLFSMTRGRTRPVGDGLFDLISVIRTLGVKPLTDLSAQPQLDPEHHTILAMCSQDSLTVAEIGSYTDLPLGVVRVLLGDLYDADLIDVTRPVPLAELPDERLLREVINGLRAL